MNIRCLTSDCKSASWSGQVFRELRELAAWFEFLKSWHDLVPNFLNCYSLRGPAWADLAINGHWEHFQYLTQFIIHKILSYLAMNIGQWLQHSGWAYALSWVWLPEGALLLLLLCLSLSLSSVSSARCLVKHYQIFHKERCLNGQNKY